LLCCVIYSTIEMLIKLNNPKGKYEEWCMLEFQGEIVGECEGKELGVLEIKDVSNSFVLLFVEFIAY
jgi:hypothetical protein